MEVGAAERIDDLHSQVNEGACAQPHRYQQLRKLQKKIKVGRIAAIDKVYLTVTVLVMGYVTAVFPAPSVT